MQPYSISGDNRYPARCTDYAPCRRLCVVPLWAEIWHHEKQAPGTIDLVWGGQDQNRHTKCLLVLHISDEVYHEIFPGVYGPNYAYQTWRYIKKMNITTSISSEFSLSMFLGINILQGWDMLSVHNFGVSDLIITIMELVLHYDYRADSRFAPNQRETALLCNNVSHRLGANLESALWLYLNI